MKNVIVSYIYQKMNHIINLLWAKVFGSSQFTLKVHKYAISKMKWYIGMWIIIMKILIRYFSLHHRLKNSNHNNNNNNNHHHHHWLWIRNWMIIEIILCYFISIIFYCINIKLIFIILLTDYSLFFNLLISRGIYFDGKTI